MAGRILIVEDEVSLSSTLSYSLQKDGFETMTIADGDEVMFGIDEWEPDLILLDWMLPGTSGIDICRDIRNRSELSDTPIIMMTARDEEADKIRGLETGADDYLSKPFSIPELTARMRALLRRARPGVSSDVATYGDLTLDRESRRVHRGRQEIHLGPTEFKLLDTLMRRPGRVYSREQLLDLVWGDDVHVETRTVDVHIGRLRKALKEGGESNPIRTVRAAGYALDETYQS